MILTYRRPGPPDTHAMTMVNNVIEVLNYVIAAHPLLLNFVIADTAARPLSIRSCHSRSGAAASCQQVISAVGDTAKPAPGHG